MKKKQAAAPLGSKTTSQPSGTSFSDNQVIMKKLKIFRGHILLFWKLKVNYLKEKFQKMIFWR